MQPHSDAQAADSDQYIAVRDRESGALRSWTTFGFSFVLSLIIAFGVNLPNLKAVFGPIDDHEPLSWLGADGILPITDFWAILTTQTEAGEWGASGRFRPAYYAFRIGETIAFGDSPTRWYFFVTVIYALTCALLAYTVSIWLSQALPTASRIKAIIFTYLAIVVSVVAFAGMHAWVGIATRLAPAELLGLLAVGALILAITKLSFRGPSTWWLLALTAVTVAVFSKESFAAFALLLPLVGWFRYSTNGRSRVDLISGALGVIPAAALALIMVPHMSSSGSDIYGQSIGSSRLESAVAALIGWYVPYWAPATFALLSAWLAWSYCYQGCSRAVRLYSLYLVFWLISILFLDAGFYGGNYSAPRYFAVFGLSKTLQVLAALCLAAAAFRLANSTRARILAGVILAISALLLFGLVRTSVQGLSDVAATAQINRDATIAYQVGLTAVLDQLSENADTQVIVSISNSADYEPLSAVLQAFNTRTDGRVRAFVVTSFESNSSGNGLERVLANLSRDGSDDWHSLPLSELSAGGDRICVVFNTAIAPADVCGGETTLRIPIRGM
jgi:hypothetical protein